MPIKLRDHRRDITLEVFVLEMLSHGVNTPYALLKQAGLSVGATYKLLQELGKQKLLASSQEATEDNWTCALRATHLLLTG